MLNKIIKSALDNRIITLILSGVVLLWGTIIALNSDVDIFPDLNAPTVVVMTEAGGLAPEEVEKGVTYPIETAMNGASNVRRVRSSSSMGFSVVWVEFDWDTDPNIARQVVSERLMTVTDALPPGVGIPTMGPQSSILGEMLIISLTSHSDSTSMMQLRSIADRVIAPRLLSESGVSQVSVIGGDVAQYQIQLKPNRMRALNVTLQEVRDAVGNINGNVSGGVVYDYGNEYIVKGDLHTSSVEKLSQSVVRSDSRGIITLADISDVLLAPESPRLGVASEKAHPAVLITVTKQPAASTIDLTKSIEQTVSEIASTLPCDVKISTDIFRQSDFIDNSMNNLKTSLFEGSLFVILVLYLFLLNFRTTLISLVALPLSIIVTLIILHCFGFTINTMSLGGIAIAIGSLVDDAIVDVENVYHRLRENYSLPKGERQSVLSVVYHASGEVRLPILNSTLIIIISFLPLFFLSGFEGRLLIPLGISFIVSLVASTIVALTLTPVLCSYLLTGEKELKKSLQQPRITRLILNGYEHLLKRIIKKPKTVISATLLMLVLAVCSAPFLGRSFLPPFNEGSLTINVSALPGISLEESDRIGREAEKIILSIPEIKTVARKTGRAELDEHSLGVNVSEIEAPYELEARTRNEMVRELRAKLKTLPGVNIEIGQPISHRIDAMLSGAESQIAIKVFGDDLTELHKSATEIKAHIEEIPGVVDVNVEQQIGRPQIDIRPKREMMARYGITNDSFRNFISTMLSGEEVSQVYEGGYPYAVVLKVDDSSRQSLSDISQLLIDSNVGAIPLSVVADIVSTDGPNTINRENVKRRIIVSANVEGTDLRGAVNDIRAEISENVVLPEGYYIEYGGQFESESRASKTLLFTSFGAILIILLILLGEYRSFKQSLIILVNMPLAMIGGILILLISGSELNIPAIIGFISLLGIATRNGMLLISRYNALKNDGVSLEERIVTGSKDRLTPIVMTALTSALALIPLACRGTEPGNEIQSPMALVILGGLITSTILNIFVIPILYKKSEKSSN